MTRRILVVLICLVSAFAMTSLMDGSDADDSEVDEVWYSYHTNVVMTHVYDSKGVEVQWTIRSEDGTVIGNDTGKTVEFDASGHEFIYIDQKVIGSDGATDSTHIKVFIVPTADDPIVITFMDNGVYHTDTIHSDRAVRLGQDPFIKIPEEPTRPGYVFVGWFKDINLTEPLDVMDPVLDDMIVYAGWAPELGGGSSVTVGGNTIVFNIQEGLEAWDLRMDESTSSVSLCVGPKEGYTFKEGSITVRSGQNVMTLVNGRYAFSGITGNMVFEITGERLYSVYYSLNGVTVSAEGYNEAPELIPDDTITMTLTPDEGSSLYDVRVFMDSTDVTDSCYSNGKITIDEVNGNLFIVASSNSGTPIPNPDSANQNEGFPWWIVVIVIVAVVAIVAAMLYRRNKNR